MEEIILSNPLPSKEKAVYMHAAFRQNIYGSLIALVKEAEKGLKHDYFSLLQKLSSLKPENYFSPLLYSCHYDLLNGIQANNPSSVIKVIDELNVATLSDFIASGFKINTVGTTNWEIPITDTLKDHPVPDRFGRFTSINALNEDELNQYTAILYESISLIKQTNVEMYYEFEDYVRFIKLSKGSGFTGATSSKFFGAIFLREPYPEYDPFMYFFEHLIHETSHLHLNLIFTFDSIAENHPNERFKSPLRRDPRPMIGLLHAMFVLFRMIIMYRAAKPIYRNGLWPERLLNLENKFAQGLLEIKQNAKFTPIGKQLYTNIENIVYSN